MKHTVIGIFHDSNRAGEAVSELKDMGYTKDISVISRDVNAEGDRVDQVKQDLPAEAGKGASVGSLVGGVTGAVVGLLAGAAVFTIPGAGIAIAGPLAATLIGAGIGGGSGALIGALADMGIPNERARKYAHLVESGEILVAVTVDPAYVEPVEEVMTFHQDVQTRQNPEYGEYSVYNYPMP